MNARTRRAFARAPAASYTATEAKNRFGEILHEVARGGPAVVTSRNRPRAVILSYEDYRRSAVATSRAVRT